MHCLSSDATATRQPTYHRLRAKNQMQTRHSAKGANSANPGATPVVNLCRSRRYKGFLRDVRATLTESSVIRVAPSRSSAAVRDPSSSGPGSDGETTPVDTVPRTPVSSRSSLSCLWSRRRARSDFCRSERRRFAGFLLDLDLRFHRGKRSRFANLAGATNAP